MLIAPLLLGYIELLREESKALYIDLERKRDIRYFSNAFTTMIEHALRKRDSDDKLMLSKEERVTILDTKETTESEYDKLVIALDHDMFIAKDTVFHKEIYARHNVAVREGVELRAVCAKKQVVVCDNVDIGRWIDSEGTMTVYDNVDLGVSATSANRITLGRNVRFKRLYSPMIQAGVYPGELVEDYFDENYLYDPQREREIEHNKKEINKNDLEDGKYSFSVVTKHTLNVLNDIVVDGDISSNKDVVIMEDAIVYGSIFAEGNIYLRKGARVLGNLFAQQDIIFSDDVIVGSTLNTVSILSRGEVELGKRNVVYGFINAERGGIADKQYADVRYSKKYFPAPSLVIDEEYDFNIVNYDTFDKFALRKNENLKRVVFNLEDKVVDKSILFGSENIEEVVLPKGIETIEDFAFAELKGLKHINLSQCERLKYIGDSVFRKCQSLEKVTLPSSVEYIGEAAFIGCLNLKEVVIPNDNKLIHVGNYAFSACDQLDRSFADKLESIDTELIFTEASLSSADSEVSYFGDISMFSEAALPMVYGEEEEDARFEYYLGAEEKRRIKNENRIFAYKETPLYVYFVMGFVILLVVLNIEPLFNATLGKILPEEAISFVVDILFDEPEDPQIDFTVKSNSLIEANDEYYIFEDRILKIFNYTKGKIDREVEGVDILRAYLPLDGDVYYMLVPGSISADKEVSRVVNDRTEKLIRDIYTNLPPNVTPINVYDKLVDTNDYYFYRTNNTWTSRGAYIGYKAFSDAKGFSVRSLEAYNKRATTTFVGDLHTATGSVLDYKNSEDVVESYTINGQHNSQIVTKVSKTNRLDYDRSPLVSTSRGGYSTFMGSRISHSIVKGDAINNKSLLVISTSTGYALTPFLTTHYENIIYINPIYFEGFMSDMVAYVEEYNIKDVLILQSVHDLEKIKPTRFK